MNSDFASQGAKLSYENANQLFKATGHLNRQGLHGPANALCVLAFEEAAKAVSLIYTAEGVSDAKWLLTMFREHRTKHKLAANVASLIARRIGREGVPIALKRETISGSKISAMIESWSLQADELKKRGFYVDFVDGNWLTPSQVTEEHCQNSVLACSMVLVAVRQLIDSSVVGESAP